jgi:hypothetical protein
LLVAASTACRFCLIQQQLPLKVAVFWKNNPAQLSRRPVFEGG